MSHLFLLILLALPLTAQAVLIDNGIPLGHDEHWSVDVLSGGATESVVFTTDLSPIFGPVPGPILVTENMVSSYRAFVDPGNDGQGFALHGSAPVRDPTDNSVSSFGTFTGAYGNTIHWEAVSELDTGRPVLYTNYTFTADTQGPIGPLHVYQYLDADIQDPGDDVFGTWISEGRPRISIYDSRKRFGVMLDDYLVVLSGARSLGLAADSFNRIQERIMGSGQAVALPNSGLTYAQINLSLLDNFAHDSVTHYYGTGNIVSVLAWDIDPEADDARIGVALSGEPNLSLPLYSAEPAQRQFSCRRSGCVVRVTCMLSVQCETKVELFVEGRTKFAGTTRNILPGATVRARPRLTNAGKRILRANRNKTISGLMRIIDPNTGNLFSSTVVRIRLR